MPRCEDEAKVIVLRRPDYRLCASHAEAQVRAFLSVPSTGVASPKSR